VPLRVGVISPIYWRTPPRDYGPWELVASLHAEGLVDAGAVVTLFATGDSTTRGALRWRCPRPLNEDPGLDPKVYEHLHVSLAFEGASRGEFDVLHNHFDFMGLSGSRLVGTPLVTTVHGFSSEAILPAYREYDDSVYYVSTSFASRHPALTYAANVYHGVRVEEYPFSEEGGDRLAFFGRIAPDRAPHIAVEIARRAGKRLVIAGIVQDRAYFEEKVLPAVDGDRVVFAGVLGPKGRNELLPSSSALLHPVQGREAFGLSMVEAMACGTPVVAFPRDAVREVVDHGRTGFVVPDVDAAVRAVGLIGEIDRSECRRRVASLFSSDRMAREYLDLYERIVGGEVSPSTPDLPGDAASTPEDPASVMEASVR